MLVLTRQIGETIVVGDNITIMITDIRGDRVRVGVDAPKDIPIHRLEIYNKIKEEERNQQQNQNAESETHVQNNTTAV